MDDIKKIFINLSKKRFSKDYKCICANRYNPWNRKIDQNERFDDNLKYLLTINEEKKFIQAVISQEENESINYKDEIFLKVNN